MFTNSKLTKSVRLALLVGGASVATLASNAVVAQETPNADSDVVEKISVTGSRIKRTDIESASPVTILDRAALELSGLTDIGDFLQSIPSMSGSPIGTTTNNGGNGSVQIDLRGLGTARTLTLVNGKRTVDGGDFQTIPSTMIEQVEILKDGASAVYGADAVAGVVNIVTRKDFNGVEITAQTSDWNDTEGAGQDSLSLIVGKTFAEGNFVFGAERVEQEEAFQSDTPWDFMQNSFYIYPAGCENQVAAPYDGTPQGGCYPIGSSRIPESRLSFYSQGLFLIGTPATQPNEVGLMVPHDGRTYNYAPVNYMQTPYERTNVFAEANFDLTDNIRFSAEFRGNQRTSAQQLAPLPFTGGDPMYDGFYDDPATGETVAFTGISQDNYYLRRAVDAYNAANGTSLVYEPVVNPRRRMIETNRRFEQTITQYQWTAALEGEFGDDYSWDVYFNQGHRSNSSQDFGQFSGSRLFNALGPSADLDGDGVPECYADVNNPGTLIVGCVPLNMFGGGAVDAAGNPTVTTLTQEMIDYVSLDTVDSIVQNQRTYGANISGFALELPGGELGWSLGYSYWRQDLANILDSAKTIGAVTGNVGASTTGELINNAIFGELYAPIFDNGEQKVALKAGVRYDDWDAFGSDTTYQLGLEVSVFDDLKLRSTVGTVFRAPTITDLFGGQVDSFPTYNDPCVPNAGEALPPGCAQVGIQTDSQVLARVGGNPELKPETGDSVTVGVVYSPEFGDHNFTFIADYWSIELEEGISSLGVQFTLNQCYVEQVDAACSLITRNNDYSINNILDAQLNVSEETAAGIDTEFRWNYASDIGDLRASLLWTHVLEREQVQFAGNPVDDFVGRFNGSAFAEDKANISLQWTKGDFSVSYLGEYISGLEGGTGFGLNNADGTPYLQQIDAQYYSDIVGTYTYDDTLTFTMGITNITDEAPPFIDVGFNGKTDPSTYRMFGTGYYLRLKYTYE
ncbi:TonB-dependent siderophore receptor [Glaciecola sp. KUL10]|uniref:TonB-dependent receptor plug domain-containing protein n=1 Tax=Glaciecola sp. (strain KUL10) TaxID=2161813 RepID=UPI000D782C21|nr:TonB-dependent receptor [Glaciecola sp. KUL10]GBL06124.1 TonB-dependent receptor, plug [Glaciecola sp. KUL10]